MKITETIELVEKYNPSNCEFVDTSCNDEVEHYIHKATGDKISVPLILHNSYWVVTRNWDNATVLINE